MRRQRRRFESSKEGIVCVAVVREQEKKNNECQQKV